MPLPFAPPSGAVAVVVERVDAAGELSGENALFRCKSIAPAAREMPRLDRKGGRRKAKDENSLEAGNGVVESDAVMRMGYGRAKDGGWRMEDGGDGERGIKGKKEKSDLWLSVEY